MGSLGGQGLPARRQDGEVGGLLTEAEEGSRGSPAREGRREIFTASSTAVWANHAGAGALGLDPTHQGPPGGSHADLSGLSILTWTGGVCQRTCADEMDVGKG